VQKNIYGGPKSEDTLIARTTGLYDFWY